MPLIKPEIQEVLRKAGFGPEALGGSTSSKSSENSNEATPLVTKLNAAGLSIEETLEELANIAKNSGNETLRARCLETVLKAHGALKESNVQAPPSFNIIINGGPAEGSVGGTRVEESLLASGQNPILYPRQLLNKIELEN